MLEDLRETLETLIPLARSWRLFVKSNFLVNFVCGGAAVRCFETLQGIRLKSASVSAMHSPGPVQRRISSPKKDFHTGIWPPAYLLWTQVRKLLDASRPANASNWTSLVADKNHFWSYIETQLSHWLQAS